MSDANDFTLTNVIRRTKTMANSAAKATVNKKAATKEVATKATKKAAPKTEKKVENAAKVSISMDDVMKELKAAGIKVYNPDAKGKYRIFGTKKGSSLNVQSKSFVIYSTDEDYKAVSDAKIEGIEATEGTNSQDKSRPNTVKVPSIEALKLVLPVYALNPMYSAK